MFIGRECGQKPTAKDNLHTMGGAGRLHRLLDCRGKVDRAIRTRIVEGKLRAGEDDRLVHPMLEGDEKTRFLHCVGTMQHDNADNIAVCKLSPNQIADFLHVQQGQT